MVCSWVQGGIEDGALLDPPWASSQSCVCVCVHLSLPTFLIQLEMFSRVSEQNGVRMCARARFCGLSAAMPAHTRLPPLGALLGDHERDGNDERQEHGDGKLKAARAKSEEMAVRILIAIV